MTERTRKHSAAPWTRDRNSGVKCDVRASNGRKVALCWGLSTSKAAQENRKSYRDECDANARLIATAPELLDLGELLERQLVYEIRASETEGDDEGVRMKTITLNMVRDVLGRATATE